MSPSQDPQAYGSFTSLLSYAIILVLKLAVLAMVLRLVTTRLLGVEEYGIWLDGFNAVWLLLVYSLFFPGRTNAPRPPEEAERVRVRWMLAGWFVVFAVLYWTGMYVLSTVGQYRLVRTLKGSERVWTVVKGVPRPTPAPTLAPTPVPTPATVLGRRLKALYPSWEETRRILARGLGIFLAIFLAVISMKRKPPPDPRDEEKP